MKSNKQMSFNKGNWCVYLPDGKKPNSNETRYVRETVASGTEEQRAIAANGVKPQPTTEQKQAGLDAVKRWEAAQSGSNAERTRGDTLVSDLLARWLREGADQFRKDLDDVCRCVESFIAVHGQKTCNQINTECVDYWFAVQTGWKSPKTRNND